MVSSPGGGDDPQRANIGTIMTVPIRAEVARSRLDGVALADLLGHWPTAEGPLYRLLAARISRLADTGELPSGLGLPPERDLADALSVSRNTVAAAYQQLRDEGLAHSRQGAGTRITRHRTTPAGVHRANGFFTGMLEAADVRIDLTLAAVACPPPVAAALADPAALIGPGRLAELAGSSGYLPLGLPALRAELAAYLSREHQLATAPEQIVVTTGAQQALDLLVRAEVLPGQPVVVEDPTFPGLLDSVQRAGARIVGVPASGGTDPDRLGQVVATHQPALVYLTLTHHNPTGRVMPAADRQRVAALAAAHPDTLFVEDFTLADLSLDADGAPSGPAALAVLADRPNVVTVGSLSKAFWGGLRTGYARGGAGVISRLAAAKAAADLGSPVFQQAISAALVGGGHAGIVAWQRARLREQRDALDQALRARLPDWTWTRPPGGLTLWAELPGGADGGAFAQAALRHGVAVVPGRLLSASALSPGFVRIAYTQPPDRLRAAADALAAAWDSFRRC
jgi:DNA-binding transcriptional MocR family regulator